MPELPEVNALVEYLDEQMTGTVVAAVELASFAVLKTYDPPVQALQGLEVSGVSRHGKFIDIDVSGIHVVVHLAKAGWLRWSEHLPDTKLKLGASNIAARVRLDRGDGPSVGFDVTEAGTRKGLSMYVVNDPAEVEGVAALGPDPLDPGFDLRPLLARKMQVKRLLRDQKILAGVGNAYSDEILHAARLSPFAIADGLKDDEVGRLEVALQGVLRDAVEEARGKPAEELKDDKRTRMRVHGRAGEACPVCGDTVLEVVYADSSLQYCPTCQTGGKPLKDRATSKFLK
ncbi:MAG: endonuclease [Aeromicrobium sp.]|nr:endonuclease [Aeromicrobium sp.]